ncbi:hypothetical protein niasHT_007034 [Heterodera trifolii]|uniref:Uncharacterized protein n=1 Tax=Heterodera trifolii TaxID=157864 RepID=A0ABD2LXN5_9BILA
MNFPSLFSVLSLLLLFADFSWLVVSSPTDPSYRTKAQIDHSGTKKVVNYRHPSAPAPHSQRKEKKGKKEKAKSSSSSSAEEEEKKHRKKGNGRQIVKHFGKGKKKDD